MRIVIMTSGTQGDTMPFVQLAHVLRERYGHVVRIATHGDLRGPVEKAGLRFYPLKGSAHQMASWGPSFSLDPIQFAKIAMNPHSIYKVSVIRTIILSTIKACTEPDPADENAEPFHADCIIANPVSFGHIHCAEALGVPLHLFFPNPWVATVDFPHPFASWPYKSTPNPSVRAQQQARKQRAAQHAQYSTLTQNRSILSLAGLTRLRMEG